MLWRPRTLGSLLLLTTVSAPAVRAVSAQRPPAAAVGGAQANSPAGRQRLILKDGSYQIVLGYQVKGSVVRYRSAERNGAVEEIPLALVDLAATELWKRRQEGGEPAPTPVLSPELQREEADRAARTPFVAPDLPLPEEDSVLALDTFRGTPELVPLPQGGSDLNKETAHAVQKGAINPASSPHRILELQGSRSDIQLHVPDPVFFVRVGPDDDGEGTGSGLTVDTGGAAGRATPSGGSAGSTYVVERLDVRSDTRVVDSFRLAELSGGRMQTYITEMKAEPLPGGHWMKLTSAQPLDVGEYALIEVLNGREVNLNVWDFGVHSTARENVEGIQPEERKPATLERRPHSP